MELLNRCWKTATHFVNGVLGDREPWQIAVITCGSTLLVIKLKHFLIQHESIQSRMQKTVFNVVRWLPPVKRKIEQEMDQARKEVDEAILGSGEGAEFVVKLPVDGLSHDEVIKKLTEYQDRADVTTWQNGWVSGCVYSGEAALNKLGSKVYEMFSWTNPLHPEVFPDIRQMEAEVVRMCLTMFHGGPQSCGTTSSGGTESILLACLAYRNLAYTKGIQYPEIVAPVTAHAAFNKACELFRMKLKLIDHDPITKMVDVKKMRRAINSNTCMLVGSAPDFPSGQIDPIAKISELGVKYKVPVHVDACLGGFLIAFMDKAGYPLDPFDFRLDGVTSISCDTHKYGYAAKGTSVILYRDKSYRKHQFSCLPDWRGGIYATPTLAGSRGGAIIAICWATMMYKGEKSYIDCTRKIIGTARYIAKRVGEIKQLQVIGNPQVSVVAIESDELNIFQLSTLLNKKGWILTTLQRPPGIHIMVTMRHTQEGVADRLVDDLKSCVEYIKANPHAPCEDKARIYGMAQDIPDQSLISDVAVMYLDALYSTQYPSQQNQSNPH